MQVILLPKLYKSLYKDKPPRSPFVPSCIIQWAKDIGVNNSFILAGIIFVLSFYQILWSLVKVGKAFVLKLQL